MPRSRLYQDARYRRERARSLAKFFAAGALLSTVAIVVPGWEHMHRLGIGLTVVAAAGSSLFLVALGSRVPEWLCQVITALGTGLIAVCQVLAGSGAATATYALLYVWVALYASLFFSRRAVFGHIVLTVAAHAGALAWVGQEASLLPQLALTLGSQIAACLVVGSLTARLRDLANTDPLTGLYNRRSFAAALDNALSGSRRSGDAVCVVTLDLDGFKKVNDEHGHSAGDELLIAAAAAWRRFLRPTDTLARTGGDEFQLLLPSCDLTQARAIIDRLLEATPDALTCSAGLALWDGHESPQRLLDRTDTALYKAKARRRGTLAISELGRT